MGVNISTLFDLYQGEKEEYIEVYDSSKTDKEE